MSASSPEMLFDEDFLKKIEYLYVMSKKLFVGQLAAKRKTRKAASGIEFVDHRDYSPGDDLRALDWKIYGRSEKLLLKLFEEDEDLLIYLLIDVSESMLLKESAKLKLAKRIAAALAYIGLCNQDRICLIPFANGPVDKLPPCSGRGQIFKVFRFLERQEGGGETSFEELFKSFGSQKRQSIAVLISDFYNPTGYEQALKYLHYRKFESYLIQIIDENEAKELKLGDLSLVDSETGQSLDLTLTPALIARYEKAQVELCSEIERQCAKRQMRYFRAPLTLPFDELIMRVFRSGGFLS